MPETKKLSTLTLKIPAIFPADCRRFARKNGLITILNLDLKLRGQVTLRLRDISGGKKNEIDGMAMLALARDNPGIFCGYHQVFQLLEMKDKIPADWEDFSLAFPGTIFRDANVPDLLYILCLDKFKYEGWMWHLKVLTDKFSPDTLILEVGPQER